jgi:hypothetical protein
MSKIASYKVRRNRDEKVFNSLLSYFSELIPGITTLMLPGQSYRDNCSAPAGKCEPFEPIMSHLTRSVKGHELWRKPNV